MARGDACVATVQRAVPPSHAVRVRIAPVELDGLEDPSGADFELGRPVIVGEHAPDVLAVPSEAVRRVERDVEVMEQVQVGVGLNDLVGAELSDPERTLHPEQTVQPPPFGVW